MQKKRIMIVSVICILLLTLCACGTKKQEKKADTVDFSSLSKTGSMELNYATQYSVDEYDGYKMITIVDDGRFLLIPEGVVVPQNIPEDVTVLQQPLDKTYLVSTSVMDLVRQIDAMSDIRLSGTKEDGWYVEEAREAMEEGDILYAGKYSTPDYELILDEGCNLAIENTMIYHNPEVKEKLEELGIPVLVERSSYETDPLARMEWVKLYGILLGRTEEAERIFDDAVQRIAPLLDEEPTGKTAAFFSITSNNLATVRKGGDYVAKMIGLAGGSYVFADLTDSGNNLATVNISLEDFYAGARDADVLLYNSTIEGELRTMDELLAKCPMLADFKAVQSGSVWCTSQSLFQQSMELPELILDMNRVFTEDDPDDSELTFLTKLH